MSSVAEDSQNTWMGRFWPLYADNKESAWAEEIEELAVAHRSLMLTFP